MKYWMMNLVDINLPQRNLIKALSQSAHMAIITEILKVSSTACLFLKNIV